MMRILVTTLTLLSSTVCWAGDVPLLAPDAMLQKKAAESAGLVILDVRTPKEYADGHVAGAVNISSDELESRLGELEADRDRDVVVYCRTGHRAGIALGILEKAGFKHLYHLEGDYTGWAAAKRPIEK